MAGSGQGVSDLATAQATAALSTMQTNVLNKARDSQGGRTWFAEEALEVQEFQLLLQPCTSDPSLTTQTRPMSKRQTDSEASLWCL
eukprot:282947-Rhodomonas_salina.1